MIHIEKLCAKLTRHRFRRLLETEFHDDFSKTRYYSCRCCGKLIKEGTDGTQD